MILFGLNGLAGSGKDTVAKFLVGRYGFTRVAFADAVRDVALSIDPYVEPMGNVRLSRYVELYGWDTAKREFAEIRRLLQVIGTEAGRQVLGEDCWVNIAAEKIAASNNDKFVITDMRFPNEVKFVEEHSGVTVKIIRPSLEADSAITSHISEQLKFNPDYQIINDSNLIDLKFSVDEMLKWYYNRD